MSVMSYLLLNYDLDNITVVQHLFREDLMIQSIVSSHPEHGEAFVLLGVSKYYHIVTNIFHNVVYTTWLLLTYLYNNYLNTLNHDEWGILF